MGHVLAAREKDIFLLGLRELAGRHGLLPHCVGITGELKVPCKERRCGELGLVSLAKYRGRRAPHNGFAPWSEVTLVWSPASNSEQGGRVQGRDPGPPCPPHSRAGSHWDDLDECAIGTLELAAPGSGFMNRESNA